MHFGTKSYLKNTHNHTDKHALKSFKASLTLFAIVNQLEKLYTVQIERPFCDSFSKEWGLLATILGRCLCSATFLKPVKFDPPPSLNAIN
jgi:hypothetical protein